jgi:outer membrane autotransporter protein
MRIGVFAKTFCFALAILASPPAVVAQVQINQNFISQGPAPTSGPFEIMGSADAANGTEGTSTGAVQAVLVDPLLGPDTIFIGATSGGIWKSTDRGSTWTPLTDNQSILSIASLGFDASDNTGQTLIAGKGITSSGSWSPALYTSGDWPLIHSTDGGTNWTPLAGSTAFANQNVVGVAANGGTIMAATFDQGCPTCPNGPTNQYGLYRSVDGGKSFTLINSDGPISSLPAGAVTALVADKSDPTHATFYAAVTSPTDMASQGVYVTKDSGETWRPFFTKDTTPAGGDNILATDFDNQFVFRLATAPNGSVAISVIGDQPSEMINGEPCTLENGCAKLKGLYLGTSATLGSSSWTALQPPDTNSDGGALYKAGLTIDPNSPSDSPIVYVSGDYTEVAPTYPSPVFRVPSFCVADAVDNCSTRLICELNSDGVCVTGSTPTGAAHADSRALAVDSAGNLLLVGDGGVYKLSNPQNDNGVWSGLNTTLQVHEPYQIGYGAYAKRLVVAAQDTGVALQTEPNSPLYTPLQGFDGYVALARDVNDTSFADRPVSVYYTSSYYIAGLTRLIVDGDGKTVSPEVFPDPENGTKVGVPVTCTLLGQTKNCGFITDTEWNSVVLNRIDQSRLAIAGEFPSPDSPAPAVFVAEDKEPASATSVNLDLTNVGFVPGSVIDIRMAYGAPGNPNAILVGGDPLSGSDYGSLYFSETAGEASLNQLTTYQGDIPISMVFGMNDKNFYVADGTNLWGKKAGTDFTNYDSQLSYQGVTGASSVEFINNNGVDALLVGGLMLCPSGTCASWQSPIAVADSDKRGELHDWRPFGSGLPNALVYDMSYNPVADVLAVAGVGRGVWTLYDVTSYFSQAKVLQFGLAGNDSRPIAAEVLTDGTRLDGKIFSRSLKKYGPGTMFVDGIASYTGGTTIFDGTLQLGTGGESGSILGDVSFCSETIDPRNGLKACNQGIDKFLVFDRSDTYSFDGAISGSGQVVQNGTGKTILTGNSTYTGPTLVKEGALIVNGSIASSVGVNFGALLGGGGSVGATNVAAGGTLAPGNSIGTLTVNGNLNLDPGAIYEVEANAQGKSDKTIVKGTVNLTGATLRILAAGGAYKPKTDYVIIDNDGSDGVNGTFGQVTNNLAFLTPSIVYDGGTGNDVVLALINTIFDFCSVTQTSNQCNVANAISQFPIDNPLYLAVISQTEQGARQAFDALSGELHATVAGTLADDSRYVRDAMLGRMMQATYSDGAGEFASLAAAGPQVASLDGQAMALGYDGKSLIAPERAPLAFWTRAFGAWGNFNGDGNAASADRDLGGFISGMDANIGGSWRAGLATGASFSNVSVDARYSSADIETYHLGGYIGGMAGAVALRGGGAWAWNNIDTSRAVVFPGFYERQNASYDADTGQLFGEVAYPTQMGGMALEPFGGLAYVSIDSDRFRERGGALASLRGDTNQDVDYSTVGLRAATIMHWGEMLVTPHVSAAWQHAFDDVTPEAALAFASTGIGFNIAGVPLAEDSALLDAGLDVALGDRTTAGVSYTGQYGDGVTDNGVKGRFTWLF